MQKNKPRLIMVIGLPASGKSTHANKISNKYNAVVLSSDKIREELFEDANSQDDNSLVFDTLYKRANEYLFNNKSVIIDSTNISHKRRRHFLNNIVEHDCEKVAIVMATPYNLCIDRNLARERSVPTSVVERMYKSFYMPHYSEGFDEIKFGTIGYEDYDSLEEVTISEYNDFNQHNPHHSLTLGEHMDKAGQLYFESNRAVKDYDNNIMKALQYHDSGKSFVMQFKDYKNRETSIAHYYGHESVSAYKTMIDLLYFGIGFDIGGFDNLVEICNLIQYHMLPYHWTDKSKRKWTRRLGEDFIEKLEIVNKYDRLAH